MSDFNYEKAYFTQAKPAFLALNHKQRNAHSKLIPLVGKLQQGRDLNIPISPAMVEILNELSSLELAGLSRASYFVGYWKPSNTESLFPNTRGESWKISNCCNQILRNRLLTGLAALQIHEGKLRRTFSGRDYWTWEEFGLATEDNIQAYNNFEVVFNKRTLEHNISDLKNSINDLWDDVDNLPDNIEYIEYLKAKTALKLQKDLESAQKELDSIKNDIKLSENKYNGFQWLFDNGISFNNVIYYSHTDLFSFGWRSPLSEIEKTEIESKLQNFPYKYELK